MNPKMLAVLLAQRDPVGDASTLNDAKEVARVIAGRAAEAARQRFVTPGDGKAQAYQEKSAEVTRWRAAEAAAESPNPEDYPWAAARAARLGVTAGDVIGEWETKAAGWAAAGIAIEDLYETAMDAIDMAADVASIRTALAITWPSPI